MAGIAQAAEDHEGLRCLLEKIHHERGFDFREYRESTLARRLGRRLRARCVDTYAEYARILENDPDEFKKLFDDLTINVTSFFRDEAAFEALKEMVVPALLESGADKGRRLRIWSAACATGEEPYSIAMLLLERLGAEIDRWDIQIAGTDMDPKALCGAQEGVFAPNHVKGIQEAWLDKYFVPEEKGLRVQPDLRRLVTFQVHNLVSDPYCRDLDLVVCRNVLIYFTPALQTQVLKGFHEGLRQGGFLLLGKAEAPAREACGLFDCVDSAAKLYQKLSATPRGVKERREPQEKRPAPPVAGHPAQAPRKLVVIASSAGGIGPLKDVLSSLPADLAAAVLIVQHLQPGRKTLLHEFLARHCALRVCLAGDGQPLERATACLAPPGHHLCVEDGRLRLDEGPLVHYVRPAADVLFASAARAFGPDVIGVVLSGNGHDGAHGCQEIKARGGTTIAQDGATCGHFAMPKAAIDAGAIDCVLPPSEIAQKIASLIEQRTSRDERQPEGE